MSKTKSEKSQSVTRRPLKPLIENGANEKRRLSKVAIDRYMEALRKGVTLSQ